MSHSPVYPTLALARIVGTSATSRGEVLAKLLRYADRHELRDPADELTILLDADLKDVFGRERMTIAEIEREIGRHVV